MEENLDWLLERGHDVIYQTRKEGVRGHFLTLYYLPAPYMSFHEARFIESVSLEGCLLDAREWIEANIENIGNA